MMFREPYYLLKCIGTLVFLLQLGGGLRGVVSTAAFHARVRGSVPGLGGLKETKMFISHPRVKLSIVGSLRDREVACLASDRQDSNFESCVWRTVSSHSSHHPQEALLAQFSLYVHKGGLKPDSFHFVEGTRPTSSPTISCFWVTESLQRHGNAQPSPERQTSPKIHIGNSVIVKVNTIRKVTDTSCLKH